MATNHSTDSQESDFFKVQAEAILLNSPSLARGGNEKWDKQLASRTEVLHDLDEECMEIEGIVRFSEDESPDSSVVSERFANLSEEEEESSAVSETILLNSPSLARGGNEKWDGHLANSAEVLDDLEDQYMEQIEGFVSFSEEEEESAAVSETILLNSPSLARGGNEHLASSAEVLYDLDDESMEIERCVGFSEDEEDQSVVSERLVNLSEEEEESAAVSETIANLSQLQDNQQKCVHLVTWSRANANLLGEGGNPRQLFGELLERLFQQQIDSRNSQTNIEYWACAQESHRGGGYHFHCAIKFTKRIRWLNVSEELQEQGIYAHFQSFQTKYKDAWSYITKEDRTVYKSANHPALIAIPPRNMRPSPTVHSSSQQLDTDHLQSSQQIPVSSQNQTVEKTVRLTNIQVSQIILDNNIHDDLHFLSVCKETKDAGQPGLTNWICNRTPAQRKTLIQTTWDCEGASQLMASRNMTRIQKLEACLNQDHAATEERECNGTWLRSAIDILRRNNISLELWQRKIFNALKDGRKKENNIFLLGQRNCGKTFLLKPLKLIFSTFSSPAQGAFNWVDAPEKEVVLLNDFRYPAIEKSDKVLPWQELLNLLEGETVQIATPKSFYAANKEWTALQPIFGSGYKKITHIKGGEENVMETEMMHKRIFYIQLTQPIPDELVDYDIVTCPRCFAQLILNGPDIEELS